MDFLLLQSFTNYIDAHIIRGRLQEEGINCWLKDENVVTVNPIWTNAAGGIKLMVPRRSIYTRHKTLYLNLIRAREIISPARIATAATLSV